MPGKIAAQANPPRRFASNSLNLPTTSHKRPLPMPHNVSLIALLAWLVHGQALNLAACAGIALIVAGVIVLNVFGQSGPSLH